MKKDKIIIVGGARDYHVIDWYKAIKNIERNKEIILLTDTFESEGLVNMTDDSIVTKSLFIVDKFLFSKQSKLSNIWRNIFKLIVLPIQIYKLKKINRQIGSTAVFHAMPMYYMLLCWLAGCRFIGTPQGSEILVRPFRSKVYKYMAKLILKSARVVTVDSKSMSDGIKKISKVKSVIIQNGIDLTLINNCIENEKEYIRDKIVSIRGMTELYNIYHLVDARNQCIKEQPLELIYPFTDDKYLREIQEILKPCDRLIGRLDKLDMYQLLQKATVVISIPSSDSSPRSVYEAIFLGCGIITVYNSWFDGLPNCMKKRIIIVDLNDGDWLKEGIARARPISKEKYIPSSEAVNMFDEKVTLKRVIDELYK
jgi:hypothetical protein